MMDRPKQNRFMEDRWQAPDGNSYPAPHDTDSFVRILPWPQADDGVPEPPLMQEVWPGRQMFYHGFPQILTGAPPIWDGFKKYWVVSCVGASGPIFAPWKDLTTDRVIPADAEKKETLRAS